MSLRVRIARAGSPVTLALLRIVVPVVILASPELYAARGLAASPEHLAFVPEGLGVVARVPLGPEAARVLQVVAASSAATAILGWGSRVSMLLLTVSAGLLFSLSQRQGAVIHDMHLFWMTALLAASPCGDVWSLDAWGKSRPHASVAYGVPLDLARLLLGLVYFFPGLHKLRASGLSWMTASNVTNHMHAKWLEHGAVPLVRIDLVPALCAAGAVLVVVFELSFVFLALASPKTRLIALGAGLLFHLSTQLLFFIPFVSLWACYVVLLDVRLPARAAAAPGSPEVLAPPPRVRPWPALAVGILCAGAAIVQGVRGQTQAWPFACYPTFAHVQGPTIPDVLVELTTRDGATTRLTGRERHVRSQNAWGRVFRLSGAYGEPPQEAPLRDHAREVARGAAIAPETVTVARLYRIETPTAPEAWGQPPRKGTLLIELPGPL